MFKKTILKNGVRIITVPRKNTQAVTVLVLVGTGSKYETKKVNGISHFLEHMMFKGTKKRPSPIMVAETLDRVGGIFNAFTGEDYTGYFAKVAAQHFDLALDWVSDIFLNSILPKKEMEKERGVIIEEINMNYDHPMSYVEILWNKLLYGDQPAGWNILGPKENVLRMSREELANYRKKQYTAQNIIVSVAGNFSEEEGIEKIKKYFLKARKGQARKKAKVIEEQERPNLLLEYRKTDQTHLFLGVRGYNLFHPQRYAQDLLGTILGGMMSSRLFVEIREKLGAAYYIKTDVDANPDTGFLATRVGVDNAKVEDVILAILEEYRKISQKNVLRKELQKCKDYLKGKMALSLESSDAQASFYSIQELLEKRVLTQKEICAKIDKVESRDILRVAQDIFQPKNLNLALIGPFKDKNKFKKLLELWTQ